MSSKCSVDLYILYRIHCPPPRPLYHWNHQPTSTQRTRYPIDQGSHRDVVYIGWPIAPTYMSPNAGGGDCWVSVYEYSCAHGAQINFGDLNLYLTYGIGTDVMINYCLSTVSLSFRCEFSCFLIVSAYYIILKAPASSIIIAKCRGTYEWYFHVACLVK